MAHLVASLGQGATEVLDRIVSSGIFDKIYLITDAQGKSGHQGGRLPAGVSLTYIVVDFSLPLERLMQDIVLALKRHFGNDKMTELDIALNISSGNGREHAAIISALMKLGYGIRLIELDEQGDVAQL